MIRHSQISYQVDDRSANLGIPILHSHESSSRCCHPHFATAGAPLVGWCHLQPLVFAADAARPRQVGRNQMGSDGTVFDQTS